MTDKANIRAAKDPFPGAAPRRGRSKGSHRRHSFAHRLLAFILIAVLIPLLPMGMKENTAFAEIVNTGEGPGDVYFYAPETLYTHTNFSDGVQYFADTGPVEGPSFGTPRNDPKATNGYVNFYCEGASDITFRPMVSQRSYGLFSQKVFSIENGGSYKLLQTDFKTADRSYDSQLPPGLIRWEATFTKNGGRYKAYCYSYIYSFGDGAIFGAVTRGVAKEKFTVGSRHHHSESGVLVGGVHSVGNNTGTSTILKDANYTGEAKYNQNVASNIYLFSNFFSPAWNGIIPWFKDNIYDMGLTVPGSGDTTKRSIRRTWIEGEGYYSAIPYGKVENVYGGIVVDTSRYTNLNQIPYLNIAAGAGYFKAYDSGKHKSNASTNWNRAEDGDRKKWNSDLWINNQCVRRFDTEGAQYGSTINYGVSPVNSGTVSIPIRQYICVGKQGDGDFAAAWMTFMSLNVTRTNKAALRKRLQDEIKKGLQPEHYANWTSYQEELDRLATALCRPDSSNTDVTVSPSRPGNKSLVLIDEPGYYASHTGRMLEKQLYADKVVTYGDNVVAKYAENLNIEGYRYPPVKVSVPGSTARGTDEHLPDGSEQDLSLTPNHGTRTAPSAPLNDSRYPGGPLNINVKGNLKWKWWLDPIEYTIKYEAGEHGSLGEGLPAMPDSTVKYDAPNDNSDMGKAARLKNCAFIPEEGYAFTGWLIDGRLYQEGDYVRNLTSEDGKELKAVAQWKSQVDREIPLTVIPNSDPATDSFETGSYTVDVEWQTEDPSWSDDPAETEDPDGEDGGEEGTTGGEGTGGEGGTADGDGTGSEGGTTGGDGFGGEGGTTGGDGFGGGTADGVGTGSEGGTTGGAGSGGGTAGGDGSGSEGGTAGGAGSGSEGGTAGGAGTGSEGGTAGGAGSGGGTADGVGTGGEGGTVDGDGTGSEGGTADGHGTGGEGGTTGGAGSGGGTADGDGTGSEGGTTGEDGTSGGDDINDRNSVSETGAAERKFNYNYEYIAILSITPKDGYTFNGIPEDAFDYFNVHGANSVQFQGIEDGVAKVRVSYKIPQYHTYIVGDNIYGSELSAHTRDNPEGDITYQWFREDQPIDGATESTYTLASADTGKEIRVVTMIDREENSAVTSIPTYPVEPKAVALMDTTVEDKEYDGNNVATVMNAGRLEGLLEDDRVTIQNGTALFDNKKAGEDKEVTFSNFGISGEDAANYVLIGDPEPTRARIWKKVITATPQESQTKRYGEDDPLPFGYEFSSAIQGETPAFEGSLARSEGDAVGAYPINLGTLHLIDGAGSGGDSGFLAENYELELAASEVNFTITPYNPEAEAALSPTNGRDDWYKAELEDEILLTAPEGYQISLSNGLAGDQWSESVSLADEDTEKTNVTYYLRSADTKAISEAKETSYKVDMTAPYASIKYKEYETVNFLGIDENAIYNRFFNRNQLTLEVDADDQLSGISSIEYQLVNVDTAQINAPDPGKWRPLLNHQSVRVSASGKFILYVLVMDEAGNKRLYADGVVAYRNSQPLTEQIEFSKASREDVEADVYIQANTVKSITIAPAADDTDEGIDLEENVLALSEEDYAIDENTITFSASCLNRLATGAYKITISYNPFGEAYKNDAEEEIDGINEAPNTTAIGLRVLKSAQEALGIVGQAEKYTWGDEDFTLSMRGGSGDGAQQMQVDESGVLSITEEGKFTIHKAGTATVTATKESDDVYYEADAAAEIVIEPREISEVEVTLTGERIYTGSRISPDVEVTDGAIRITEADYDIEYGSNVTAGAETGSVTLKGKGNYTGEKTVRFGIERSAVTNGGSFLTIEKTAFPFTGSPIIPAVTSVTLNGEKLPAEDYDISYEDNTDVGTARVTATAKSTSNYIGSVSTTFSITRPTEKPAENSTENPTVDVKDEMPPKAAAKHAVKFNVSGGKALKKSLRGKKITGGKAIGKLPTPKHAGHYTFKGWYTKKDGGKKITARTTISGNTTFYAHWKKQTRVGTVVNAQALYVRRTPSVHSDLNSVVGYLQRGQRIQIIGMVNKKGTERDWYIIRHKGKIAYVYAAYIRETWR